MKRTAFCLLLLLLAVWGYAQIGRQGARYASEGLEYYQRGEYGKAIGQFLAADRSASAKVPEYHYWLGRLHIAVADTAKALDWFAKYQASGDQAYSRQVEDYLRIFQRQSKIFGNVSLRPLPDYLNSPSSDYGAIPDPDGKYLYFTSLRPAPLDKENIWRAEIFRSGFGRPELVKELSTDKNEAFGCFSLDQSGAWIFGNYGKDKRDGDLYYVAKNGAWTSPENIRHLNSPQVETHPMVFRDRVLFFASSRDGGQGGMDLYVSEKIGGNWTNPINLGPQINSAGNEQTPFLDFDGRTLIFASNGHPGFGGYDLFKAYRTGSGWQDWSLPENLGLPFNSTRDDRCFYHIPASNQGYISSDRGVAGFEKIYQVNFTYATPASYLVQDSLGTVSSVEITSALPELRKPVSKSDVLASIDQIIGVFNEGLAKTGQTGIKLERSTEVLPPPPEPEPVRRMRIRGTVRDQLGGPVSAEIEVTCLEGNLSTREFLSTDAAGNFSATLPLAETYSLVVNAAGYLLYSQEVKPLPQAEELVHYITLQKLEKQASLSWRPVLFAFESSQLDERAAAELDDVVLTLLSNPEFKLRISGHAWDQGTPKYNKELSERRAQAVYDYLVSKGVSRKRLNWKGYGNTRPLNLSATQYDQARNRRVEIEIVK